MAGILEPQLGEKLEQLLSLRPNLEHSSLHLASIWMPDGYLLVENLEHLHGFAGDDIQGGKDLGGGAHAKRSVAHTRGPKVAPQRTPLSSASQSTLPSVPRYIFKAATEIRTIGGSESRELWIGIEADEALDLAFLSRHGYDLVPEPRGGFSQDELSSVGVNVFEKLQVFDRL